MKFGSTRAYISQKKIDKLSSLRHEEPKSMPMSEPKSEKESSKLSSELQKAIPPAPEAMPLLSIPPPPPPLPAMHIPQPPNINIPAPPPLPSADIKHELILPGIPPPPPIPPLLMKEAAAPVEPRINPKHLSTINEDPAAEALASTTILRKKSRSRSRSLSSVSDEELDKFHSDEEASPPMKKEEIKKEEKKKKKKKKKLKEKKEKESEKSKAPIQDLLLECAMEGKPSMSKKLAEEEEEEGEEEREEEEEKKKKELLEKKFEKREMRMQENYMRHGKLKPEEPQKEKMSVPLSMAAGTYGQRHEQEVDTNVLSISLSVLKDKTQIATGDPVVCKKCKAMFNVHSKLEEDPASHEKNWLCEFCSNTNKVVIEQEEMPKAEELTYILESAQQSMIKKGGNEDISLVFCIDVSGSMCVSKPVEDKKVLKFDKVKKLQDLMKFSDGSYQYTDREKRNQTYVSRMQCVQAAIEKQILDCVNGAPKRKVGIVTFNNDVTLIGDGSVPPKVLTGDKLNDYNILLEDSQKDALAYLSKPVAETKANLITRLGEIEECGQTALGPGLLVSLGIALKGSPGSKVIICTDGLANVGLGSVDDIATEAKFNAAKDFYTKIGELAKSKGVSISIISMVGEECRLEMLSPLADLTAGDILKVDPTNLSNDFANILSETVIATNVEVRLKLHKGLTFRNEDVKNISEHGTLLIKPLGNVTEGQEVTLEYCAKSTEELKVLGDIDFSKITKLPFQTQISYRSLEGMKCVRLITKLQDVSSDKEQVKKEANYALLSVNAVQQTAKMAKEGNYRGAQANAYHWKRMMKGSEAYEDYMVNAAPLYDALDRQQEEDIMESQAKPESKSKEKPKKGGHRDYIVSESNQGSKMTFSKMTKK